MTTSQSKLGRSLRLFAVTPLLLLPAVAPPGLNRDRFKAEMDLAMKQMDQGMGASVTGDPDSDFAAMMIPHHEGAIAMARAELAEGSDERLRRLAAGMVVEQAQEIQVLKAILAERRVEGKAHQHAPMHGMVR